VKVDVYVQDLSSCSVIKSVISLTKFYFLERTKPILIMLETSVGDMEFVGCSSSSQSV